MIPKDELIATVKKITCKGKGILAADESPGTLKKKFDSINLPTNEENSRHYREILFTTEGIEQYISGVILYQETLHHKTSSGIPLIDVLKKKDILIGIKVDLGMMPLKSNSTESFTLGMDDLDKRCAEFYKLGCRFAKWRCVLKVGTNMPSSLSIRETAYTLARYASICQKNGIVPIVEPELLSDGTHSLSESACISRKIFAAVIHALQDYEILLEGCLLKPHMITQGSENKANHTSLEIAEHTLQVLRDTIPPSMGGIFFLSGGQGELEATENLHNINSIANIKGRPWPISFSYGRALQNSLIKVWGSSKSDKKSQEVLLERARMNSLASQGIYDKSKEWESFKNESMFQKDYSY